MHSGLALERISTFGSAVTAGITLRSSPVNACGSTLSPAGISSSRETALDEKRLAATINVEYHRVHRLHQVHGTTVVVQPGNDRTEADAHWTQSRGDAIVVLVADCCPLLLSDDTHGVVGAAHCGWRGTAGNIAAALVRSIAAHTASTPRVMRVWLGPCAGANRYEVSAAVAQHFSRWPEAIETSPSSAGGERFLVDLRAVVRAQLVDEGVAPEAIETHESCTISDTSYHSFRRDGFHSGRMAAYIAQR